MSERNTLGMEGVLTPEGAHAIFNLIVWLAGATESDREQFVSNVTTRGLTEWRFMGDLGGGGKVRLGGLPRRFYVSAYPEDLNSKREHIIRRTNDALSKLDVAACSATGESDV